MRATIIKLILFFLPAIVFTSCKKNLVIGDLPVNTFRPIVEFSDRHFKSVAMDFTSNQVAVELTDVRFMIRSEVDKETTVKISLSAAAVENYNAENGTNYTPVGVPVFSLVADQFTLSPSERSKPVSIMIRPTDVATGENAIGLVITQTSTGEVSQIADTLVVALAVKNKYDGVYNLRGFHNRTSPDYSEPYDVEVQLITSGPNSVYMYWDGEPAHPIAGGTGSYTSFTTNFIFDPASDKLVAWDLTPYPTTVVCSVGPATDSRFDPVTRTIYAQFYYNNNPAQRGFSDTLRYLGPR